MFSSFTCYKASKLDRFTAMNLRGPALHCRSGVLLQVYASECSSGVIPSCYFRARLRPCPQPETPNLPNLFTKECFTLALGFARGTSQSNFYFRGPPPPAPGRALPSSLWEGSPPSSNSHGDLTVSVD